MYWSSLEDVTRGLSERSLSVAIPVWIYLFQRRSMILWPRFRVTATCRCDNPAWIIPMALKRSCGGILCLKITIFEMHFSVLLDGTVQFFFNWRTSMMVSLHVLPCLSVTIVLPCMLCWIFYKIKSCKNRVNWSECWSMICIKVHENLLSSDIHVFSSQ